MLKNENKLKNVDVCLHLLASKRSLNQVVTRYKSNQVAYIIKMTIA